MATAYDVVRQFEKAVAAYAGSRYAVAVDSCTAALFLCCRFLEVDNVTIPSQTYCSVPCSILHAGGRVQFRDYDWNGDYELEPYGIFDSALRFRRGMYREKTFHCVSFHAKKHVKIGRGGMILCDYPDEAAWFRLARFSGRHEIPYQDDQPSMVGWQFSMCAERAARGLVLLDGLDDTNPDLDNHYPDLSKNPIYHRYHRSLVE